ncbi:hypothetical protein RI367_007969 [Sorochytrium milnesiophthora]
MLVAGIFALIDLALLIGFIALILWILAMVHILAWTGGAIHILIVLAVICMIAWVFVRFFRGGSRGGAAMV